MSANIYEIPNLTMSVRYCKGARGDGGERVERLVDIYEGADTFTDPQVDLPTRDGGAHTQRHLPAVQRNPFRAAALVLGLLCLLLVGGVTALYELYISVVSENDQLRDTYEASYENLSNSFCQTQGNDTGWRRFRCSCYYMSTEMKNWEDSESDCRNRAAYLVIINNKEEQEFVSELNKHGASWIGLQAVIKDRWTKIWEWKWVDESTPTYLAWQTDMTVKPVAWSAAYNLQGKWTHANNGSNQWICEKQIH